LHNRIVHADAQTIATMHTDFKEATTENKRMALECAAKVGGALWEGTADFGWSG